MAHTQTRKPTNVSLDSQLLAKAKALNVNLSRAAEEGIRKAVRQTQEEIWKSTNIAALESSNEYVEKHGLPLSGLRQF